MSEVAGIVFFMEKSLEMVHKGGKVCYTSMDLCFLRKDKSVNEEQENQCGTHFG